MKKLIERRLEEAKKIRDWHDGMSAKDWSLYTADMYEPDEDFDARASAKAATALNRAMSKYQTQLTKNLANHPEFKLSVAGKIGEKLFYKIVDPVHQKYRSVGAGDTEVYYMSRAMAQNMITNHYGKRRMNARLSEYI